MSRHNFIISILQKPKRLFKISKNDYSINPDEGYTSLLL